MSVIIPSERLEVENLCFQFPYRLDDFQMNGIYGIENNKNILITAHTSAGKSTLAEYAIAKSLSLNKKVIYTSPIKTLSNQKYYDFKEKFNNVGILTGDIKLNPEADVLIMTTEILRNKLDFELEEFNNTHCVIYDEVHYLNDPDRGFVWEESITKLPKHIILVMLSATIDKANEFANWICSLKEKDTYLIGTDYRPVPLNHYIYLDNQIVPINQHKIGVNQKNIDSIYTFYQKIKYGKQRLISLKKFLQKKELFPAIVFSFSRKKCLEYCQFLKFGEGLLNQEEKKEMQLIIHKVFSTNLHHYKDLPSTQLLLELMEYGVCIHHSGILPIQKELIEILFCKGLIKVLFATETFAVGVNMPTKTVIFTELSKFDGYNEGGRMLRYDEFMQMSGRAGRRGKDTEGFVIYLPMKKIEQKSDLLGLLKGRPAQLVSQYDESNNTFIRLLNQKTDIESFYEKSLYGSEVKKNQMFIEKAKINLEKQINSVNINSFLTEDDEEFIRIYNELQEKILLQKGKQYKKTKLELEKMEKEMSKTLKSYFEKEKELLQKKENLKRLEENLDETNNELKIRLNEIKSINESQGLIKDEKLTSYGKIVAHLTNCSELLLGKLIAEKYFDDKDWKEIGMVLSLLVEEKDKDGEINNQIIQEIQDEYYNIIEFYEENNLKYKINFTKVFVKPFMLWMEKKPLIEILSEYNNFDGNFVKNLYKIRDVCQEIVKICEMFNMMDLLEKINVLIENIIYGIGEFDSLYVNHYELVNKLLKN